MDFPGHFQHIFKQLNHQRLHAQLCDCVVVVGGQTFQAHRSILAACSSHFRALLSSTEEVGDPGADRGPNVMELDPEVVTPEAFSTLLDMIYTSTLSLRASNVMDVLLAASHLHLNAVVKACKLHLSRRNFPSSPTEDGDLLSPDCLKMTDRLWENQGDDEEEEKYEATKGESEEIQLPSQSDSSTGVGVSERGEDTDGDTVVKVKVGEEVEEPQVPVIEVKKENLSSYSPDLATLANNSPPSPLADNLDAQLNDEKMVTGSPAEGGVSSLQLCTDLHSDTASEDVLSKCKKAAAQDHVLLVEGEKKYACKICCKTFMNLTDCKKHIRVHTGEKPYPCPKCGKRFSQSSHLYKHSKNTCLNWKDDQSFPDSLDLKCRRNGLCSFSHENKKAVTRVYGVL
uniref:Zinc finger and BTB domain containing 5 n=1 Tax=Amphiprion percula TaxID=161767 RepID=A0A3P8TGC9_AMPPE